MDKEDKELLRLTALAVAGIAAKVMPLSYIGTQIKELVERAERREADEWYPNKYPDM